MIELTWHIVAESWGRSVSRAGRVWSWPL